MNILMIKLSAIGDVVHTLPSLSALRRLYPEAHITWLIEEAAADLITGHPHLNQVLVSRRKLWLKEMKAGSFGKSITEIRSLLVDLRSRPYDLVIDFHGLFKSALLAGVSGGIRKLGYASLQEGSGLFYNEKIPEDMNKHAVDRYLDFIVHLGGKGRLSPPAAPPEFLIPWTDDNLRNVISLFKERRLDIARPFVAMNPVALWNTKLWRPNSFALLADRIVGELGLPVVITGSAQERPYIAAIRQQTKAAPILDLSGQTTLKDLACLYRRAALVVTTDSGPMHIAAAVGTPVVALFGPTDPRRTGPYGAQHLVVRKEMACSPCFRKKCPTRACMEEISGEEVWKGVKKRLERGRDGGKDTGSFT